MYCLHLSEDINYAILKSPWAFPVNFDSLALSSYVCFYFPSLMELAFSHCLVIPECNLSLQLRFYRFCFLALGKRWNELLGLVFLWWIPLRIKEEVGGDFQWRVREGLPSLPPGFWDPAPFLIPTAPSWRKTPFVAWSKEEGCGVAVPSLALLHDPRLAVTTLSSLQGISRRGVFVELLPWL